MNRTRKIVAAGIGAAVVVVILAMVLLVPNLHTQTPVSTAPPSSGSPGSGGSGGTGTGGGSGSGNGTLLNCNVTGDSSGTGSDNATDSSVGSDPSLAGNETNGTQTHGGSPCAETSGDPDAHGDQESAAHASPNAKGLADELGADILALVPLLGGVLAAAGNTVVAAGRSASGFLGGLAASFSAYVLRR